MSTTKNYYNFNRLNDFKQQVNQLMNQELNSTYTELQPIIKHLLNTKGKLLRPILVYCTANLHSSANSKIVQVAAAAEIIHIASLIHDDIIDNSSYRRGQESINFKWNTNTAVLVGDHLFSRAFSLLTKSHSQKILEIYTNAISSMCQGELLQSSHNYNPYMSEQKYFKIIDLKTASLVTACCLSGGVLANCDSARLTFLSHYGLHLGRAYQIIDDIKDISSIDFGDKKPSQKDILQGNITLPIIYLINEQPSIRDYLTQLWTTNFTRKDVDKLLIELINSDIITLSIKKAEEELNQARQQLNKCIKDTANSAEMNSAKIILNLLINKLEDDLIKIQRQLSKENLRKTLHSLNS